VTTAIAGVVDATLVTALGLLVCVALRRRSAALRHMILAATLAAAAAAPIFEATLPHWELQVLSSSSQAISTTPGLSADGVGEAFAAPTGMPAAPRVTWSALLLALWGIGFVVVWAGLLAGFVRLVSMTRRCRPAPSNVWRARAEALSGQQSLSQRITVLESPDPALLLTWGVFRPRIVIPAGARSWARERIEVVLAHEIAHIARRDWVVQIAAETVRAVYWFNPLIWVACRRLRHESEQACDDIVLRRGIAAADYASHLLAVARQVVSAGRGWASAPAVANASTLERRIAAMLNASRNREPLTRTVCALAVMAMLAVTMPIASATLTDDAVALTIAPAVVPDIALVETDPVPLPTPPAVAARPPRRAAVPSAAVAPAAAAPGDAQAPAQPTPATFGGVVRDATGGVMPGVLIALTDTASGMSLSTTTDPGGRFLFRNLAPSSYQFRASLPGFATQTHPLTLPSGADSQQSIVMAVGMLMETVTVAGCGAAAVAPRPAAGILAFDRSQLRAPRLFDSMRRVSALAQQGVPVRVGGNIRAPRQIKKVAPACPGTPLPANGFVVILEATIGVDGLIKDIRALRPKPGELQQEFAQAAMDAVRQWEYTPTLLNNVPTPVIMTVTVSYTR
jgi:beta-lactamase regulating signal transducer with metallopeptidase domain